MARTAANSPEATARCSPLSKSLSSIGPSRPSSLKIAANRALFFDASANSLPTFRVLHTGSSMQTRSHARSSCRTASGLPPASITKQSGRGRMACLPEAAANSPEPSPRPRRHGKTTGWLFWGHPRFDQLVVPTSASDGTFSQWLVDFKDRSGVVRQTSNNARDQTSPN